MRRTGGAAAFLLAVACALVAASGAWACTALAYVFADPGSGAAGTAFEVQGRDFTERAVEIRWGSADGMVLGMARGPQFAVRVVVPDVGPGDYRVFAVSEGYQPAAPFRVTASPTTTTTPSTTTSPSSSDTAPSDGSSSQPGSGSTEPSTQTGDDSHSGTSTTYTTAPPAAAPGTSSGGGSSTSSPPASTTSTKRGAQPSASPTTTAPSAVQVEGAPVVAEPPPQPGSVTTVADVPPVHLLEAGLSSSGRTENDDGPLSPFLLVGAVAFVAGATSVVVRRRRTSAARNTSS